MDLEKVLVTKENIEEIREKVGFVDLREDVKVGRTVSVNRFTHEGGQSGALLVIHERKDGMLNRAGICFGGNSEWGDWRETNQTVWLDDQDADGRAITYDAQGRRLWDWRDLSLTDGNWPDDPAINYGSSLEHHRELVAHLREFRLTRCIVGWFFEKLGLSHEEDDNPSTWGPKGPEYIDWTGFPGTVLAHTPTGTMVITDLGLRELAKRGATLRDYLALFCGEELDGVLAMEPEAAGDLNEPVTQIWERREAGGKTYALHAGSTIWIDTPGGHITSNDDDLDEFDYPAEGWKKVYPE